MKRACAAILVAMTIAVPTLAAADDITDAIDAAQKAYRAGDLSGAKQSLDLASQLIGQKNAEVFGALMPKPLTGWTADDVQTTAGGGAVFGASMASRRYSNPKGDQVDVQITGDSAVVAQFAPLLANPTIAGALGKIVRVGSNRAIQTVDGDIQMVVANKFLISVQGSSDAASKLAYAQAIDVAKLSKM